MEISVLQSLIDRNSNEITICENIINTYYNTPSTDRFFNKRLDKLRKIQIALKVEISEKVCEKRGEKRTLKVEM